MGVRSASITAAPHPLGGDAIGDANIGSSACFSSVLSAAATAAAASEIVPRVATPAVTAAPCSLDDKRETGLEASPSRLAVLLLGGGETSEIPNPNGQARPTVAGETGCERVFALLGVLAREYG